MLYQKGKNRDSGVTATEPIPGHMKAVVGLGREGGTRRGKDLGYEFRNNHPTPVLSDDEVLLRVKHSGYCHTDDLCANGLLIVREPTIFGHEFAGRIVAAGRNVNKKKYLDKNMVAMALYGGTGYQSNLNGAFAGTEGNDGGFAEHFKADPEDLVMIPKGVTTEQAFYTGDAGSTSYNSVSHVMDVLGDSVSVKNMKVVIYGADGGGLAIATALNFKGMGVRPKNMYLVGIREKFLKKVGATLGANYINSHKKPVALKIREMAGGNWRVTRRGPTLDGGYVDAAVDCVGTGGNMKKVYSDFEKLVRESKVGSQLGHGGFKREDLRKILHKNLSPENFYNEKCFGNFYEALIESAQSSFSMSGLDLRAFIAFEEQQFMKSGTVNDAHDVIRRGGVVEVVGSTGDYLLRKAGEFMETQKNRRGPWGGTADHARAVLKMIKDKKIKKKDLDLICGAKYTFTKRGFEAGVKALHGGKVMGRLYFEM